MQENGFLSPKGSTKFWNKMVTFLSVMWHAEFSSHCLPWQHMYVNKNECCKNAKRDPESQGQMYRLAARSDPPTIKHVNTQ